MTVTKCLLVKNCVRRSGDEVRLLTIVLGGLELPEGDVDSDTTLTLGLELVEHPRVLEGALAQLGSFL